MEAPSKPKEMPLKTITPEEGAVYAREAFKRGQVRDFSASLRGLITDPVQQHSYKPDANPDDPGRRRLHPILVSGLVCFGLMFVIFLYFTYWQ